MLYNDYLRHVGLEPLIFGLQAQPQLLLCVFRIVFR